MQIRSLLPTDVSSTYIGWLNNSKINEFLSSRNQVHSLSSVLSFLENVDTSSDSLIFGLFTAETRQHIGNAKLSGIDFRFGCAEIGYLIGEQRFWGMGYATEAIIAIANFAFSTFGLSELTAGANSRNIGSIRVLEKSGFQREAGKGLGGHNYEDREQKHVRFFLKAR
jgi:ribosomal-protein-alanine N-acetyltransferase